METINEILAKFSSNPFTEYLEQKPIYSKGSKSGTVDFIPWHYLCDILDTHAPGWEWEIKNCDYHGDRIVLVGRLTIHGSDGSLSREATGNESSDCGSYGDPSSNAEAMAMRRCCAKFGIARYLWAKGESQQPKAAKPEKGTITREEWLKRQQQK